MVALAWVLNNPSSLSAPIVGATMHHLTEAVAALGLHLTDNESARSASRPPRAAGSWCQPPGIP